MQPSSPSQALLIESGFIGARLDRLPLTRTIWIYVLLLSLGGFFEYYDLFFTGYIAPGLVRSHILSATTRGFFGTTGIASFAAALFLGLFVGTALFSFVADRFGRRTVFTFSLLWYTVATVAMAFQTGVTGLNICRFLAGIGVGVELVTIDSYISELVPRAVRGRVFAFNSAIQFAAVPVVALLAWLLVPISPFGMDGWRWVVLIGSVSAIVVWGIRRRVPESPRWLAQHGRIHDAQRIMSALEKQVSLEAGRKLPEPAPTEFNRSPGTFLEIWRAPYLRRTLMLVVFNLFQTVGFYGFSNWVPTLLIERGIAVTSSLRYTFIIAIAAPFGPVLAAALADRIERKWQIVLSAFGIAAAGLLFARMTSAPFLIMFGVMLTLSNNIMSYSLHAYQSELYPTRIRARAIGFVYSWSRLSVVFTSFAISFFLARFGVSGVFTFIASSMLMVMLSIGLLGPKTNNFALETISK